ncbi:Ig-like domain-containing protein, partial [Deinococcus oregonensis]
MSDGRTSTLVLLLALSLTACGGTSGPVGGAPELLAISPANGAVGVHKDTNIELSFNQPMNRASVEAAYVSFSEGLRRDQVTFVGVNPKYRASRQVTSKRHDSGW